ncbi:RNA polymerase-binding protein RbpA [Brachybacterium kimchii]|uniref:RNA polymerase-binding protein RbpA n=1 Tax=Brachybacterium kimchii TaxID=2942909 RepID=A0ABY4NAX6_9MICO|nr:RNA polymerase-binding protein RbpA [Brachybacterium kimchii]UQN30530.1 RNA polymerase-binding protein RbpA [Brachybacterium kimchii]
MTPALLLGSIPHRAVSTEKADHVVPLQARYVEYLCGQCEITTAVNLHPEASVPAVWPCRRCREPAVCTQEADEDAGLIGVGSGRTAKPPKTHWQQVTERRTERELEALLQRRLSLLRAGKLHTGPSHR